MQQKKSYKIYKKVWKGDPIHIYNDLKGFVYSISVQLIELRGESMKMVNMGT